MLNENETLTWEIAHMELIEEKLITRQQKPISVSIVDAIRRNSGYGI